MAAKRPRQAESDRQKALETLAAILSRYLDSEPMIQKIIREEGQLLSTSESLGAIFFEKKTGTLLKRAASLRIYAGWFETAAWDKTDFLSEAAVFAYVKYLFSENAPPSRAASFREAANFLAGAISKEIPELQKSRRVKGMCCRLSRSGEAVRQRDPLTVDMVKDLEHVLAEGSAQGSVDSVVAATALFAVYARARIGDLRRCLQEPALDVASNRATGFLQTAFMEHKTAKPGTRRALPVAAPIFGLTMHVWGEEFLLTRCSAGLRAEDGGSLVPALGVGGWLKMPFTTTEFATALRALLSRKGYSAQQLGNIGAHSLKSTLLSWCGKFGLHRDDRRMLGYHVLPGDVSADTYVRDLMAAPLRAFCGMLEAVRLGEFNPDATRSGLFVPKGSAMLVEDKKPEEDAESCLSSESSASELVSGDEAVEPEIGAMQIVVNEATGFAHVAEQPDVLKCGKPWPIKPRVYEQLPAGCRLCKRCF